MSEREVFIKNALEKRLSEVNERMRAVKRFKEDELIEAAKLLKGLVQGGPGDYERARAFIYQIELRHGSLDLL